MTTKSKTTLFRYLKNGSLFKIHSEPSRGIKKSADDSVYVKNCDAYSTAKESGKEIILHPNDIVYRL